MRYTLVITFPDGAVHSFPVGEAAITIGRSPATAIRVPEDGVSRQHCVISPTADRLVVLDQGSTNGTFVNGAVVRQARLNDGDVVQVGSTRIRVQVRSAHEDEPVMRPTQPPVDGDIDDVDTLTFELSGQTQVLQRLAERLASSDGAASASELVLDAIMEVFPVDRAYILTIRRDRTGGMPEIVASRSRHPTSESTGTLDIDIPTVVLRTLETDPNVNNAAEATSAVRAALSGRVSTPVMCTPLRHAGETFGALYLDALTLPVWAHSQEMFEFLSSVGALTALALTRARLQAELNLEQRLSQRRRDEREVLEEVTDRRPSSPDRGDETIAAEELRRLRWVNVAVTQGLKQSVEAQFSALDERLSEVAKSLKKGSGDAAILEAMACAKQIVTAVGDVAVLAEVEAGKQIKTKQGVDVAALIERSVRRHEARAEEQGIRLTTGSIDDGLEANVDEHLTGRVLEHLVAEALRQTGRKGRVVVSGRLSGAHVEVIVADTGKGVPRKQRDEVFSGEHITGDGRGGVGLYFCRMVVEAQGGSVRISGPTGNTQVIVSLPAVD